jgi:serine/threonine-protein kinase HipA
MGMLMPSTGPGSIRSPNVEKAEHVLNLDESDNRPSLATVVKTAEWYSLSKDRGAKIVGEITEVTRRWAGRES